MGTRGRLPYISTHLCPKLLVTIFRNLVKFGGYISKFGQINFNPVTKYSQVLTIFRDFTKFRNIVTKSFGHWTHGITQIKM